MNRLRRRDRINLAPDAAVANHCLCGICGRVHNQFARVGACLKAGKALGSILIGPIFAVASHDQVVGLRGRTHGDILRTAAAAAGARKIEHEDVGCCQARASSVSRAPGRCPGNVFQLFVFPVHCNHVLGSLEVVPQMLPARLCRGSLISARPAPERASSRFRNPTKSSRSGLLFFIE